MPKISLTRFRNYSHELRIALTMNGRGFDRVLTQDEAAELRDRLTQALEDEEDTDGDTEFLEVAPEQE